MKEVTEELKVSTETIIELFYRQVEKPKNHWSTKVFNVFDNKYRINVYSEDIENNLTKRKIIASYFAAFVDDELIIKR